MRKFPTWEKPFTRAKLASCHICDFILTLNLLAFFKLSLHPHHSTPPSSLPSPTLTYPSPIALSPWIQPYTGTSVPAGLGTSFSTEAKLGSQDRRKGIQWQGTETDTTPSRLVRDLHEDQVVHLLQIYRGLSPASHAPRLVAQALWAPWS